MLERMAGLTSLLLLFADEPVVPSHDWIDRLNAKSPATPKSSRANSDFIFPAAPLRVAGRCP